MENVLNVFFCLFLFQVSKSISCAPAKFPLHTAKFSCGENAAHVCREYRERESRGYTMCVPWVARDTFES